MADFSKKIQGNLRETPLIEVIGRIYQEKLSGKLVVQVKKAEYQIFFNKGVPVNASSSLKSDHLFEFMVHMGVLEPEDVPRLQEMVREGLEGDQAILKMGVADSDKIYYLRQLLVRELIIRATGYIEGRYQFNPGDNFLEEIPLYELSPMDIIYEAINRHHLFPLAEKLLKMGKMKIQLNPELPELENLPDIFYERTYLLDDFKNEMPLEQAINFMVKEFPNPTQALLFLYVMVVTGVLQLKEEAPRDKKPLRIQERIYPVKTGALGKMRKTVQAEKITETNNVDSEYIVVKKKSTQVNLKEISQPERPLASELCNKPMELSEARRNEKFHGLTPERKLELLEAKIQSSKDYFEALGIQPSASIEELEYAYHQFLSQFEIEKLIKSPEKDLSERANKAKETLREMIATLSNPEKRNQYEKSIYKDEIKRTWNQELKSLLAKKQFERGKWYLEHNRADFALEKFEQAIELNPEVAEYYAYYGWALYRTGKGTLAEVDGYLKQAIRQNPRTESAYYFLAVIAKREKAEELAEEYFQKLLSINPEHPLAKREMGSLQKHKKTGLFQKLFLKDKKEDRDDGPGEFS